MESQVFWSNLLLDFELEKIDFETRIENFSIKILKIKINEKIQNKELYIWFRDRHRTVVSSLKHFCPRDERWDSRIFCSGPRTPSEICPKNGTPKSQLAGIFCPWDSLSVGFVSKYI